MAFQKKNWQFNDIITEGELNRMEDGIEEGITKAEQAQQTADSAATAAANAQSDIDAHKADLVTDTDGVHGLKIEQGTWTPVLAGATTPGNHTYDIQSGSYYRLGNLVKCDFAVRLSTKDPAMAGEVRITGLPFTSGLNAEQSGAFARFSNVNLGSYTALTLRVFSFTNYIDFVKVGSNLSAAQLTADAISNNTDLFGTVTYRI